MKLLVLLGLVVAGVLGDEPVRDPRFFNGAFMQDDDSMQLRAQLRLDNLQSAMDQLSSSLDNAFDRLSDRIEHQVESSLPIWMRRRPIADPNNHQIPQNMEGLEAVSGTLGGDGVDDGLRLHFNGDLEGVAVDELQPEGGPEAEFESESNSEEVQSAVPPFSLFNPFSGLGTDRHPGFGSFFNIINNRRRQWWKGPNVCVDREEIDEGKELEVDEDGATTFRSGNTFIYSFGNMQMTTCSETNDKYTCTSRNSRRGVHKTVVVSYRCCHGFIKEQDACVKLEQRSMADTLKEVGTTDFLLLAQSAGLKDAMENNITIFVPTNEAMQEYTADIEAENELDLDDDRDMNEVFYRQRRSADTQQLLQAHMTDGIHYASDLFDEMVLNSTAEGSTLRVNTYSTSPPTATINCARLVSVNEYATNGVVHTIDRVLYPVTSSLADLITSDPQFAILKKLVSKAGMLTQLREPGQLTVFAPTDAAFRTLPEHVLTPLLESGACIEPIIKNHVLPNTICSAAVQGKARTVNLLQDFLMLERSEDDKIFVEEAQVVVRDIVGTNGVLHIIDKPLIPSGAKSVVEVLRGHNLTRFLELLEEAKMLDEVAALQDVTIFAPSNRAIDDLPDGVLDNLKSEPENLREVLNYHMAVPSLQANDISNDHIATSRSDHPIRVNIYTKTPLLSGLVGVPGRRNIRVTAACSPVSVLDSRACGAVVHVVERLLSVPRISVVDQLQADPDFSIFSKMINDTGMEERLRGEGPFTVLAPSDHVFRILPEPELNLLLQDYDLQKKLVQQHTLTEHVCCAGINSNTWLFMDHKRPLQGAPVHVRRTINRRLMAGPARITHCSAPTLNGLVHTVNHLLISVDPRRRSQDNGNRPTFSHPGLDILLG